MVVILEPTLHPDYEPSEFMPIDYVDVTDSTEPGFIDWGVEHEKSIEIEVEPGTSPKTLIAFIIEGTGLKEKEPVLRELPASEYPEPSVTYVYVYPEVSFKKWGEIHDIVNDRISELYDRKDVSYAEVAGVHPREVIRRMARDFGMYDKV